MRVPTNGTTLSVARGGSGPPIILLHGFPQTHRVWASIAPSLAASYDVILPDLRGYGDSEAPPDDAGHHAYSKREMARDIVGLLDALDLPKAAIVGHDRGARVAYRMALDHPDRVTHLA
ncbi:MAG: alpha/beta hydrolase, partial [Pseudomonadota bacterium]